MNNKKYITTPIYYANGVAHVGHFLTTTAADVIARYYRQKLGKNNVYFTTGLDEHGTTVEQSATKEGYTLKNIEKYTDKRAAQWKADFDLTNISYDYFVRTTNSQHERIAQEFVSAMIKNGDVYKKTYKGKYCTGCEKFLTLSDLNSQGYCPLHRPDQVVETEEENYFFKLSKYAPRVRKLIESDTLKIIPDNKRSEILARLSDKVEDVSISRPKEKVAWGIEFPDDPKQTTYVWVEALINYRSSIEINKKDSSFWENCWHFLGKDISWFHNVIWPAMLISANQPLHKGSFVHSFLLVGGEKISKSKGNVISPKDLVEKFGVDGARYLALANFPYENDSDVTWENLVTKYNADLANGLGNTVARIAKLAENSELEFEVKELPETAYSDSENDLFEEFHLGLLLNNILLVGLRVIDQHIDQHAPWSVKDQNKLQEILQFEIDELRKLAKKLKPFLPETIEKIEKQFSKPKIESAPALFPRLQ